MLARAFFFFHVVRGTEKSATSPALRDRIICPMQPLVELSSPLELSEENSDQHTYASNPSIPVPVRSLEPMYNRAFELLHFELGLTKDGAMPFETL